MKHSFTLLIATMVALLAVAGCGFAQTTGNGTTPVPGTNRFVLGANWQQFDGDTSHANKMKALNLNAWMVGAAANDSTAIQSAHAWHQHAGGLMLANPWSIVGKYANAQMMVWECGTHAMRGKNPFVLSFGTR
jgi:hypothetical protein